MRGGRGCLRMIAEGWDDRTATLQTNEECRLQLEIATSEHQSQATTGNCYHAVVEAKRAAWKCNTIGTIASQQWRWESYRSQYSDGSNHPMPPAEVIAGQAHPLHLADYLGTC